MKPLAKTLGLAVVERTLAAAAMQFKRVLADRN
jgi:hypothetical protein